MSFVSIIIFYIENLKLRKRAYACLKVNIWYLACIDLVLLSQLFYPSQYYFMIQWGILLALCQFGNRVMYLIANGKTSFSMLNKCESDVKSIINYILVSLSRGNSLLNLVKIFAITNSHKQTKQTVHKDTGQHVKIIKIIFKIIEIRRC